MNNLTAIGLYRHFKGDYYYVTSLCRSATDEKTVMVNYFNVCHPEYGSFVRPLEDFIAVRDTTEQFGDEMALLIKDRKDNVTGQIARFERVKDLNFQLGSVSTKQLIKELRDREDSPLQALDIEKLNGRVFCTDYVVGDKNYATEDYPCGVSTVASFETEEQAKNYYDTHKHIKATAVFKRTFIEV